MMRSKLIVIYLALFITGKSQTTIVEYTNKKNEKVRLVAYTTLNAASNAFADSVYAIDLVSQELSDFPSDVLKYKNLRYLNIDSFSWEQALDSLTELQKQLYYQLKAEACDRCGVMRYFKPSTIKKIPRKIKGLKRLEYISFGEGVRLPKKRKFKRIYRYLPNAWIFPNEYDLNETD